MTSQSKREHNMLSCAEEQVAPLEAFSSVNKDALYIKISQKKDVQGNFYSSDTEPCVLKPKS